MKCLYCGKAIVGRKRKYCDRFCRNTHRDRINGVLPVQEAFAIRREKTKERFGRQCQQCGADFIFKPGGGNIDGGKFCSRRCYAVSRIKRINGYKPGARCKIYVCDCKVCGRKFVFNVKRSWCSVLCLKEKARIRAYEHNAAKKDTAEKACLGCGEYFVPEYGSKRRGYCSKGCCMKTNRRVNRHKKRALMKTAIIESVNPLTVFVRDGWRCRICGKKLKAHNRGTIKQNAPELDHIIPLSIGGEHSYKNTQCACRRCNSIKGNRCVSGGEQLLLFGA